ncbi:PCC domain-containing protein [Cereibacter azotoformans]|uniref:PCC domain-containing protein n=1 Tax=Cereibacter azotoformans TaxID=43057 RepID=UPI001F457398|nr:DUF296 domain-containing protein [Cereibacter azotoformans]
MRSSEDLVEALEAVAARHGIREGRIRSLIGSTVGARFEDGPAIDDVRSEILGLDGRFGRDAAGGTCLDLKFALIGTVGRIHRGRPSRGESLVLICAEVFIERLKAARKLLSRHTSRDVMAEHAELFVTWAA